MAVALSVESPVVAAGRRSLATITSLSSNLTLCKRLGNNPIRLTGDGGRRAVVRERTRVPGGDPSRRWHLVYFWAGFSGRGADTGEATRQLYASIVALIYEMEAQISSLSDSQLRKRTSVLQQ